MASVAKSREFPVQRQALFEPQVASLLVTAPEPNCSIYRMALLTGLRRDELRELRWRNLFLDVENPYIKLIAEHPKNRKADILPLHTDLVAMLKTLMPGHPDTKVFTAIPGMKRFRTDLKRAGIPVDDFCFHRLRHTYCTMLVKSGCRMKEAQQLMRHSTIELTAKIYTHLGMTDIAGALDKLHIPAAGETLRATGTDATTGSLRAETTTSGNSGIYGRSSRPKNQRAPNGEPNLMHCRA
ncbi:MAG: site-specific integrase [Planctomycetia bacterium]|nr:site-specific integrase [Planctomycetia bacterium]